MPPNPQIQLTMSPHDGSPFHKDGCRSELPKHEIPLEKEESEGYDSLSSLSSDGSDIADMNDIFSKNITDGAYNPIVAKDTVIAMGIPSHIVQQVIDNHRLEHKREFSSTMELYLAAEEIALSPEKQACLARKLYLAEEENRKAKEASLKMEVVSCNVGFASLSAEMSRGAAPAKTPTDKCQLKERVRTLARENQKLKDRKMCRACRKVELATSGITFLPCGHFITCEKCSEMFDDCLACGKNIMGTVRTFLS